jgi:virginiamycin B lyase
MRAVGLSVLFLVCTWAGEHKEVKKAGPVAPANGIRTPGVQIPFSSLQSELVYDLQAPSSSIAFTDAVWIADKDTLQRIDPRAKENKLDEPVKGFNRPCAALANAFNSLWVPDCGSASVARVDARGRKITAMLAVGAATARPGIASTADSIWAFTDAHGTLSRIDPANNTVVAELRVYPDCGSLTSGESALWLTCPAENILARVNPQTNLVDKTIKVSDKPIAIAAGDSSIWVLCEAEGKIDRIDPKTNKVTKTIDLGAPAMGGSMAFGEGSLWVSMPGFPLTRIDAAGEKVVQQFWGEGAGVVQAAGGSVWLADAHAAKLRKLDPKRIAATLAE